MPGAETDQPQQTAEERLPTDLPESGASPEEMSRLRGELEQAQARVLRAQAELENYRKRARREVEEQLRYAALPIIADLLPALDNLDRAVAAAGEQADNASLLQGVKMVLSQLTAVLQKHQCEPIRAEGAPFDPHLHEAIAQESSSEQPAGYVTRVARVGYKLHDRVIRPAQVLVSTGSSSQPE